MSKLAIDFLDETATQCEQLHFRQEGRRGFKLPLNLLPEMLEALEKTDDTEVYYFWKNWGVRNTRSTCTVCISTIDDPLLQLSSEQRAKLIAHLKSTYTAGL